MAINKVLSSTSLIIEIENGTDKAGAPLYRKKTFSGIKGNTTPENVFATAEAMKAVIANPTRDYFLNDSSILLNDEA